MQHRATNNAAVVLCHPFASKYVAEHDSCVGSFAVLHVDPQQSLASAATLSRHLLDRARVFHEWRSLCTSYDMQLMLCRCTCMLHIYYFCRVMSSIATWRTPGHAFVFTAQRSQPVVCRSAVPAAGFRPPEAAGVCLGAVGQPGGCGRRCRPAGSQPTATPGGDLCHGEPQGMKPYQR